MNDCNSSHFDSDSKRDSHSCPIDKSLFIVIFGLYLHIFESTLSRKIGRKWKSASHLLARCASANILQLFTFYELMSSFIHHFCCYRKSEGRTREWFENLIANGIRNIRATSSAEAGLRRMAVKKKENFNPYQLSREWLTRVAFTWFPNKIQIPISEIESNLREWFNQNTETNRIGKCVYI